MKIPSRTGEEVLLTLASTLIFIAFGGVAYTT
jgi:hypothetical protein